MAAVEKPSQELPFWQYVRAQQIAAAEKNKTHSMLEMPKIRTFCKRLLGTWSGKLDRSSCVGTNKESHENKNVKIVNINVAGSPNSVLIKVNNQRFRSLVDTGCELCLVNSKNVHALPNVAKLKKSDVHLQSVYGVFRN